MNWNKFLKAFGIGIDRTPEERMHSCKWTLIFFMVIITLMVVIILFPVSVEIDLDLHGHGIINENITIDDAHITMKATVPLILSPIMTYGITGLANPAFIRKIT